MKKTFVLGLGVLMFLEISLVGCVTGNGSFGSSFNGTWSFDNGISGYTFNGAAVKQFNTEQDWSFIGTFTYNDTTVTFSFPGRVYTMYYNLTDTQLILTRVKPDDDWWHGPFQKQ